jgi:hypothetical protein
MTRLCKCHGEPMQTNGPVWRCAIRRREHDRNSPQVAASRRARQDRFYHEKRKHDPYYLLQKQLSNMARVRVSY